MSPLPGLALGLVVYVGLVLVVDARHLDHPVPLRRLAAWCAGLAILGVALMGPLVEISETSFSAHMVQHLLLTMVAAPLLLLGAPITLLLRAASPSWRRILLAGLESRFVAALAWPPLGWAAFAAVMWWAHLGPLFEAALEHPPVHVAEHLLFVVAALLFWRPVVGLDPGPFRLGHGGRLAYISLAMAPNLLLGMVLYSEGAVIYPTYATVPGALDDQRLGATIMWVGGDLLFTLALALVVLAWMRDERARLRREEVREAALRPGRRRPPG
ncbi:MAG TPA: cytochrome c oxidase assembly protein [Candidatus Limnocylindrales bacterium]|nr:cytochrome c oxidase assembly protein [Candidatus Limnocylindrales bacterium]